MRKSSMFLMALALAGTAAVSPAQLAPSERYDNQRESSPDNRSASSTYQVAPGAFEMSREGENRGGVHTEATRRAEANDPNAKPGQSPFVYRSNLDYQERMSHPRQEFEAARNAFTSGDKNAAELHLRRAASFLSGEIAPGSTTPEAAQLRDRARQIDDLADRVALGQVSDVNEFKRPYAEAYQSLASYQYAQARQNWETNRSNFNPPTTDRTGTSSAAAPGDTGTARSSAATGTAGAADENRGIISRTGYYMGAAAENTRNWASEAGEKLDDAGQATLNGGKTVGGKLVQGAGWTAEQVGEGIDRMGNFISRWGHKMLPGDSRTQSPSN